MRFNILGTKKTPCDCKAFFCTIAQHQIGFAADLAGDLGVETGLLGAGDDL